MNESLKNSLDIRESQIRESHYLHTIYGNYSYVQKQFINRINLTATQGIWNSLIKNQKDRETKFLNKIGITSQDNKVRMIELNTWIKENTMFQELIIDTNNKQFGDIVQDTINESFLEYTNNNSPLENQQQISSQVSKGFEALGDNMKKITEENSNEFTKQLGKDFQYFQENFDKVTYNILKNSSKNKKRFSDLVKKDSVVQKMNNSFAQAAIMTGYQEALNTILSQPNVSSRQKKSASRMSYKFQDKIEFDVDKNDALLKLSRRTSSKHNLRWKGSTDTIDNFIRKIDGEYRNQRGVKTYLDNEDDLIYTIVNSLMFGKYKAEQNYQLEQILELVRQSILFMIGENAVENNSADFLYADNKLIPFSMILEGIKNYKKFKPVVTVGVTSYKPYSKKMLKQKKRTPVDNGVLYTGALDIGAKAGQEIWNSIRLKQLNAQLKIKI